MNALERIRFEKRMTVTELAEASGISRFTITAIENGLRQDIADNTIFKLADALDYEPLQLRALLLATDGSEPTGAAA